MQSVLTLLWILCPMLNLILIFGSTNKELSQITAMFYTSLGKTAWSIGVAWIIIACATGHGGNLLLNIIVIVTPDYDKIYNFLRHSVTNP